MSSKVQYSWNYGPVPDDLEVRQVYGVIFHPSGRIFIQNDYGRYNLVGGKPERGESFSETLQRESREESQISLYNLQYLGYVHVAELVDGEVLEYAQVRLAGILDCVFPACDDPSTGRTYGRELMASDRVIERLQWGNHGELQVRHAVWVMERLTGMRYNGEEDLIIFPDGTISSNN